MKYILVIAGSDSSGGAGIQADIKTVSFLGAHALTVLTAITAQNSLGIKAVHQVPPEFITRQLDTLMEDITPDAVKVGMLYSAGAVLGVARWLQRHRLGPLVVDPVLQSSTGAPLLEPGAVSGMMDMLFPLSHVVTPNLEEASVLAGTAVNNLDGMIAAAKTIGEKGPRHVIVTGGHLAGTCEDVLYDGQQIHRFPGSKIETAHTHGSGCVFSSALATFLANGESIVDACGLARDFCRHAIEAGYPCGHGSGPVRPIDF
jgi:hydroxymethylpyrimidine kinase/phosphomethylpyrimidine kinase